MPSVESSLKQWLQATCNSYSYDLRGVFRASAEHPWPLQAADSVELEARLMEGGHLLPLPKESAALANVLEVSIVDFLLERIEAQSDLIAARGTERGYPDLEVGGALYSGGYHAVDIKLARRGSTKKGPSANTQSRVTLYTGNTYFRYPTLHWPGTFRPFDDYDSHLDVIGIYTLNTESASRVEDLELIVQEPWRIASKQRSSTTREYIGAVVRIDDLRDGRGEFETPEEFYRYWRRYPFNIGRATQAQLDKLLSQPKVDH